MATNNSSNNQYANNADGFTLGGGTTTRNLTLTGGNVTLTGAGSNTYTMPAATDTLVGRASADTLTNKTIDANGTGNSITNVASLSVKRQNDTSNSTVNGARIETGWGAITLGGSGLAFSETVTFNTAFTTAPIVVITYGGDQVSGSVAYGNGGNNVQGQSAAKAYSITTTNFVAYVWANANWSSGNILYYQWMAIGS